MNRTRFLLAALVPSDGDDLGPLHVQKTVFLAEKALPRPLFRFAPDAYGPFDRGVFTRLRRLERRGYAERHTVRGRFHATWRLTARGRAAAHRLLTTLPAPVQDYLHRVHAFAQSLDGAHLTGAVVRSYPETAACMVFRTAP